MLQGRGSGTAEVELIRQCAFAPEPSPFGGGRILSKEGDAPPQTREVNSRVSLTAVGGFAPPVGFHVSRELLS